MTTPNGQWPRAVAKRNTSPADGSQRFPFNVFDAVKCFRASQCLG
jgi:hypothetical protein